MHWLSWNFIYNRNNIFLTGHILFVLISLDLHVLTASTFHHFSHNVYNGKLFKDVNCIVLLKCYWYSTVKMLLV